MLTYERHLIVVMIIVLAILGATIATIVFDIPVPFLDSLLADN